MSAAMHALIARQREQVEEASVIRAADRLRALLAAPPAGHTDVPQPADWYEQVFDLLACTHPESCTTCTPEEAS